VFRDVLQTGAAALGVPLSAGDADRLEHYWAAVEAKNRVMNLTAITGEDDAARLHFLDCVGLLSVCPARGAVLDVGTGAGFPGVPLAVLCPDARLTLLDATEKKLRFVDETCRALAIPAACLAGRAEELGRDGLYRERFDVVVSRAVARLSLLAELCLPFVRPGGLFVAMKGAGAEEELAEAANALALLGGEPAEIRTYAIPGADVTRHAVIVRKAAATPDKYPRAWGRIKKAPL